jgi:cysteine desulfurase NifS/selenium donor protein
MKPIYLDYNATTPLAPEVAEVMKPFLEEYFGNPSSAHWYGVQTRKAVEKARAQVAALLHANPDEIIFTSGGSESNNFAIKGIAHARKSIGNHIITSAIEHPAVVEVCEYLKSEGFEITYLPVDEYGMVDPDDVEKAITPQTILITIMHANNEVGTIQPIKKIAEIAQKHEIVMHTDAAQSTGKIPVLVDEMNVDLLSIAGHKLYGPKGIGALYIKRGVKLEKIIHGADHEQNLRAGTENILCDVGLGKACEIAGQGLPRNILHMKEMRDLLYRKFEESGLDFIMNGHPEKRLPNTLSLSFRHVEANTVLSELSRVAASAGAACHSDQIDVSAVLEAMDVPLEYAMGTIRFSTGRFTTKSEIEKAADEVIKIISTFQDAKADVSREDETEIKLTHYTHGMGCACKIEPDLLEDILKKLPIPDDPKILVGTQTADDAAVYKINDDTALVVTLDFFTPIADDPYEFGAIAAANALSDIYAMGATPLFGLNIVAFPSNRLPMSVLEKILQGAQSKAQEASIFVIGGHSIEDTEPKYGMVVVGSVHPEKIWKNVGLKKDDALILTKPIGTGILSTALKRGLLDDVQKDMLISTMFALNKRAAEVLQNYHIHACTDVTGFGLLGHLSEMVLGSGIAVEMISNKVPVLDGVFELAAGNVVPGGTLSNMKFVEDVVEWSPNLSKVQKIVLCDAQTSGGLLAAVPGDKAEEIIQALFDAGITQAHIIGKVEEGKPVIRVV